MTVKTILHCGVVTQVVCWCVRVLDSSVMVRKAALQAIGQVVESDAQASQQDSAGRIWPSVYIKLAETLCNLLTVAPDSPLASQDLQQASHLATACTGFTGPAAGKS